MSRGLFLASIITLFLLTMATTQASLYIEAPSSTIVYQPVVVTVKENGTPVKDVTVYFVLNGGVPIYARTNESGKVIFKPIAPGTLDVIIAEKGKIIARKTIIVSTPPITFTNNKTVTVKKRIYTKEVGTLPIEVNVTFKQNITGWIQVEGGTLESYASYLNETKPGAKEKIFKKISEVINEIFNVTVPPKPEYVEKGVPIVLYVNTTPEVKKNVSKFVINITIPKDVYNRYNGQFIILKFEDDGTLVDKNETPVIFEAANTVTLQATFNNLSLFVVASKPQLPDLTISKMEGKVSGKKTITASVTVKNIGATNATNVEVLFEILHNGKVIFSKLTTITTLAVNEERTLSYSYTPTEFGTYILKAVVDPYNKIPELNEGNNVSTISVKVTKPAVPPPVAGGGGGGYVSSISPPLIAPSVIKYETSMYVTKGKSEVIALPKTYVEQTDITKVIAMFDYSGTVYLAVSKVKELPAEIPTPKYPVYGYVEIVFYDITGKEVTAKSYEVEFRVSKKWLEENNCKPEQVVLMKFDETWKELPTSIVSEDANYYYFKAEAKTFSIFAIAAKPVVITPTTTTPAVTTPPTLVTTPPPAPPTLTYIAIAIIVIVVIVAIIALARRR